MAEIIVGQTITTQQYANADNTSLSYYLNAYLFYVDVTLISQDIVKALSKVRIKHRMKCVRSYYSKYNSLHSDISIGDEVKNTKYLPTTGKGQTYDLAEWTGDVPHDSQGNLSIVVKGIWHGYDNNNNYGPVSNTLLNEIQFPQILRASTINVSPTFLTSGNATIMVTKHDPAYTTTLKYRVNNVDYVIATKSSNTTFYLAYNTIKNIIGSYTSAVVKITAITYSGNTILGEDSKEIIIQTGSIPLSLYDDMLGNVGATFGEKATGKDIHFKLPVHFYNEVYGLPSTTYKPNDILRLDFYGIYAGVLTSGQREIGFTLFLDKPIDESVTGVNIGSIKCNISAYGNVYLGRGSSWYNGGYEYVGQSGYTVEVNWKAGLSAITIWIKKSTAFTSTTALNNSAVIVRAQDLIINFS